MWLGILLVSLTLESANWDVALPILDDSEESANQFMALPILDDREHTEETFIKSEKGLIYQSFTGFTS